MEFGLGVVCGVVCHWAWAKWGRKATISALGGEVKGTGGPSDHTVPTEQHK